MRMRRSGERDSDQFEVWDNIAACSADLDFVSSTCSMSDIYEGYEQCLGLYREAFQAQDGQVGALVEGDDLRLSGESLAGDALVAGDRVVRLVSFNLDSDRHGYGNRG
jgi:hypothetical protein